MGGFAGLSFAMYNFNVTEFTSNERLTSSWITAPEQFGDVYVALANWEADRWGFVQGEAHGKFSLPDLAPYRASDDRVLLAVIKIGTTACELDWLRIGGLPPLAELTATSTGGLTPVHIDFDASGSTDSDGPIAEFRWDPEGDGTFEASTGTTPLFSHEYSTVGEYSAAVRVFDDDGFSADAVVAVSAANSTTFSLGAAPLWESPAAVLVNPEGEIFMLGQNSNEFGAVQVIYLKVDSQGSSFVAKAWGGDQFQSIFDAVFASDGYIYACGATTSYGQGAADALLQKWSQDGELVWSRTIGNADDSELFQALLVHGDTIYLCGYYTSTNTAQTYGLVASTNLEGALNWQRLSIGPDYSSFSDIAFYDSPVNPPAVRVCGVYYPTQENGDASYAAYGLDSTRLTCLSWGSVAAREEAETISIHGFATSATYVAGTQADGGMNKTFIARAGGSAVLLSSPQHNVIAEVLLGRKLLVFRTNFTTLYAATLVNFDNALNITSEYQINGTENNNVFPSCASYYDATRLVICGSQTGELPGPAVSGLTSEASSNVWTAIAPAETSPVLVVMDTPVTTMDFSDYAFNRGAHDGDAWVYVDSL